MSRNFERFETTNNSTDIVFRWADEEATLTIRVEGLDEDLVLDGGNVRQLTQSLIAWQSGYGTSS